jgi:hypothetical protein
MAGRLDPRHFALPWLLLKLRLIARNMLIDTLEGFLLNLFFGYLVHVSNFSGAGVQHLSSLWASSHMVS